MALTDSLDEYITAVHQKLEDNKSYIDVHDVHLGDQDRLPHTPCLSVEPGNKTREYNGAPRRFAVGLDAYIMVYVERVDTVGNNVKLVMEISERVEEVLHADRTLGGLVVSSFVAETEPGYASRGKTYLRASRITFSATSQKMLPYP